MYLRKSRVKEASQTRLRRRLAARLLPTRTHRAQGEGGIGRGRGTDTPRAKSVTNTIYRQKFAIFITNLCAAYEKILEFYPGRQQVEQFTCVKYVIFLCLLSLMDLAQVRMGSLPQFQLVI